MICLLYKELMVLACVGKVDPIYTMKACINLNGATVEDVDNGRGKCYGMIASSLCLRIQF